MALVLNPARIRAKRVVDAHLAVMLKGDMPAPAAPKAALSTPEKCPRCGTQGVPKPKQEATHSSCPGCGSWWRDYKGPRPAAPAAPAMAKGFLVRTARDVAAFLKAVTGGEGSRGGHIIGHTKSGKPIYGEHGAKHQAYAGFTAADHHDAARLHGEMSDDLHETARRHGGSVVRSGGFKQQAEEHEGRSAAHMGESIRLSQRHDARSAAVKKGREARLARAREASHVMGRTRSGKPIFHPRAYEGGVKPDMLPHTGSYSAEDHEDAAAAHEKLAQMGGNAGLRAAAQKSAAWHRDGAGDVRYAKKGGRSLVDDAKDDPDEPARQLAQRRKD